MVKTRTSPCNKLNTFQSWQKKKKETVDIPYASGDRATGGSAPHLFVGKRFVQDRHGNQPADESNKAADNQADHLRKQPCLGHFVVLYIVVMNEIGKQTKSQCGGCHVSNRRAILHLSRDRPDLFICEHTSPDPKKSMQVREATGYNNHE